MHVWLRLQKHVLCIITGQQQVLFYMCCYYSEAFRIIHNMSDGNVQITLIRSTTGVFHCYFKLKWTGKQERKKGQGDKDMK